MAMSNLPEGFPIGHKVLGIFSINSIEVFNMVQ